MLQKLITVCCVCVSLQSCNGETKNNQENFQSISDTLKKPINVNKSATLVDMGFDGESGKNIYQWTWYIGGLERNGKIYSHIHGFVSCDQDGYNCDTTYYENIKERIYDKKIEFKDFSIVNYGSDIEVLSNKEAVLLFPVVNTFSTKYKGELFIKSPTVSIDTDNQSKTFNKLVYSDYLSFNIQEKSKGLFQVKFKELDDEYFFNYKLCTKCNNQYKSVSFFDRSDGNIYFLDKDCFLELVNKKDLKRIQELNK